MARLHDVLLLIALAGGSACGEGPTAPTVGALEVVSTTAGEALDPDGYGLTIDAAAIQPFGLNVSLTIPDLPAGPHTVSLSGLAANCLLGGPNPLTVTVAAGDTVRVAFEVTCSASGALEVVTTTTGEDLDPDGYAASVDGGTEVAMRVNGSATIAPLAAGAHSVRLSGTSTNCAVAGPNPRTVNIPAGGTTQVGFDVTCEAGAGAVEVTITTAGVRLDPDGYLLTLDATPARPTGVEASFSLAGLVAGSHLLLLSDLTTNCAVEGDNPAPVNVRPFETAAVTFIVICRGPSLDGVLFSSDRAAVFPRAPLYRMRPDGSDIVDLTPTSDGEDGRWSPDGTRIAFTSYRGGNADIYLMNSDGSGVTRLTNDPADDTEPTWSPDGRRIAFVSTRTGGSNVYTMNSDGSSVSSLTGVAGGFQPSWSPDGRMIAFSRVVRLCQFDVCLADIFVVPATGGTASDVTRNSAGQAYDPAWSPDGSRIAYSQDRQLYTVRPDATGKARLSQDATTQDVAPVWSPDGSELAFTRYLGNSEVFVMRVDGTGVTNISHHSANDSASDWK